MKINWDEVLALLADLALTCSRRDCGLILAGYRNIGTREAPYRIFQRLEEKQGVRSQGRGRSARLELSPEITQRVRAAVVADQWNRPWDGKWRFVTYDLPESRRRERILLWRALHARRLGLLQKSVWVWPHDVEPVLLELVRTEGVPECFVGVEGDRLLLSSPAELVTAAWDFEEMNRRQARYLASAISDAEPVGKVKGLWELGRAAAMERTAYRHALALDPLLPRALWPVGYRGVAVEQKHERFTRALRDRAVKLAAV